MNYLVEGVVGKRFVTSRRSTRRSLGMRGGKPSAAPARRPLGGAARSRRHPRARARWRRSLLFGVFVALLGKNPLDVYCD